MTRDQLKTVFTAGGCGILAEEILRLRPDGVPVLWVDAEGYPTHAAALVGGRLLHFGDREDGYREATAGELAEAVSDYFDPRMDAGDCRELARAVAAEILAEIG